MIINDIPVNVMDRIDMMADQVAQHYKQSIIKGIFGQMAEKLALPPITSPIEQIFYAAFRARCAAEEWGLIECASANLMKVRNLEPGIHLWRQAELAPPYKCDFLVRQSGLWYADRPIVIELDGHAFHDQDQEQRSREKARDRALQEAGAMVLHYTGADVTRNPSAIVDEVFKLMLGDTKPWPTAEKSSL